MTVAVALRYEDDSVNPVATHTAVHISATDVDFVDEATNGEIRYYLSAESGVHDAARSVEFAGDFTWDNWIAPTSGVWNFRLRKVSNNAIAAQTAKTFDAPS